MCVICVIRIHTIRFVMLHGQIFASSKVTDTPLAKHNVKNRSILNFAGPLIIVSTISMFSLWFLKLHQQSSNYVVLRHLEILCSIIHKHNWINTFCSVVKPELCYKPFNIHFVSASVSIIFLSNNFLNGVLQQNNLFQ